MGCGKLVDIADGARQRVGIRRFRSREQIVVVAQEDAGSILSAHHGFRTQLKGHPFVTPKELIAGVIGQRGKVAAVCQRGQ